jgi:hypothetical protein
VVSVAAGSLLPGLITGWFCMWPWSAREAGVSPLGLAKLVLLPSFAGCLPMLALLITLQFLPWHREAAPFGIVAIESLCAMLVASLGLWKTALSDSERAKVSQRFVRFGLQRRPA